ncbi:MAG TPA: hypothetical protein VEB22_08410 [Phycisphaerales bacterium]|nr:hypothetical protein [Phycisphaerales bacterium]
MTQRSSTLVRGLQAFTITFWLADLALLLASPDTYRRFILKDGLDKPGAASVLDYGAETLTILVLIPGILCALAALVLYRRRIPSTLALLWLLAWTAACIYFAGEECSWGQWYFKWGTPETFQQINDQGETNLHNTTSWLDQKPRALVELFIVCGGLIVPVLARYSAGIQALAARPLVAWALAPSLCWPAAAVLLILRSLSFIKTPFFHQLANSEVCELATAWFLGLYLVSYLLRLKAPGDSAQPGRLAQT